MSDIQYVFGVAACIIYFTISDNFIKNEYLDDGIKWYKDKRITNTLINIIISLFSWLGLAYFIIKHIIGKNDSTHNS